MDNDSTTIKRLIEAHGPIDKLSDQNHTKKCISNGLYAVNSTHKELKRTQTVNYITKNFSYGLTQKQGDVDGLRARLDQVVPHMYGEHTACEDWCAFKKDPAKYDHNPSNFRYKSLPYKKPLQCPRLRATLEGMVSVYKNKASSLAVLGSTQANESFNNIVASKAPKSR